MNKDPAWKEKLRQKAQQLAVEKKYAHPELMSPEEVRAALHELHVHQIELEMQNEELRIAQAEIESARARYFDLYDMAPVGYCTLSDKGLILEANLTAAGLFGSVRGELIGKPFSRYVYREDQENYYMHSLRLFEEGEPRSFELRMKRDDAFFWADINATVFKDTEGQRACRITVSDISERKRAEEQLLFQSNLLASVHDAIIAVDENINVSYWNGIAEDITGWTAEEVVGLNAGSFYDQVVVGSPIEEIAEKYYKDSFYMGEVTARRKNGDPFAADVHIQSITDGKGRRRGTIASFRDVTERKRMEDALRESDKELRQADKNKNEFLSALSHELRNPLAAISAGIQILDITKDEDQVKTAKNIMNRQMDQICALVDDLLDLTRISNNRIELKKEILELNKLAGLAAEDQRILFEKKGIRLSVNISGDPVYIYADSVRIKQIIGNLFHNAYKYTQAGGEANLNMYEENGEAVISVKDNGCGLSPEMMPKLFQAFIQADMSLDRSGGGLGLGLSITKGIVELHGGSVSACSEGLGKGSEFTIRLPLSDADGCVKVGDAKQADSSARSLKVLIIEDNKDFADLLNTMLAAAGHQTEVSYDGREGLEKAKAFKPDVIFCDIGLPGMNGYEVAKSIRNDNELKGIYLIALTGYAGAGDVEHVLKAGFNRHLAKPVDLASVQRLLNEY